MVQPMSKGSFIPYLHDIKTGVVRVPARTEEKLSKILGRPVHIRNTRDLAKTFTDVMRASIYKQLMDKANKY